MAWMSWDTPIGGRLISSPLPHAGWTSGTLERMNKDSFDWYKRLIETNGAILDEE